MSKQKFNIQPGQTAEALQDQLGDLSVFNAQSQLGHRLITRCQDLDRSKSTGPIEVTVLLVKGHLAPRFPTPRGESIRDRFQSIGRIAPNDTLTYVNITRLENTRIGNRTLKTFELVFTFEGNDAKEHQRSIYWDGEAYLTAHERAEKSLRQVYSSSRIGIPIVIPSGAELISRKNGEIPRGLPLPGEATLASAVPLGLGKQLQGIELRATPIGYCDIELSVSANGSTPRTEKLFRISNEGIVVIPDAELPITERLNRALKNAYAEMKDGNRRHIYPAQGLADDAGVLTETIFSPDGTMRELPCDLSGSPTARYSATLARGARDRWRLDVRQTELVEGKEVYIARAAYEWNPHRNVWLDIEVQRKHVSQVALVKGRILTEIVAGIYHRKFGDKLILRHQFGLSDLTFESRRPAFYVPNELFAHAKWGPSPQDIVDSIRRYSRLQRLNELNDLRLEIVIYKTDEVKAIQAAIEDMDRRGLHLHCRLVSLADLMDESGVSKAEQAYLKRQLSEADDMAGLADIEGMRELASTVVRERPARVKRARTLERKNPIDLAHEEKWQARLLGFIVENPGRFAKEIELLQKNHSALWEPEYHMRMAAMLSYVLRKLNELSEHVGDKKIMRIYSAIGSMYPLLMHEPFENTWAVVTAHRQLLIRSRTLHDDATDIGEEPSNGDSKQPRVRVVGFDLAKAMDRLEVRLMKLGVLLAVPSVAVKDTWGEKGVREITTRAPRRNPAGEKEIIVLTKPEPPAKPAHPPTPVDELLGEIAQDRPLQYLRQATVILKKHVAAKSKTGKDADPWEHDPPEKREKLFEHALRAMDVGILAAPNFAARARSEQRRIAFFEDRKGRSTIPLPSWPAYANALEYVDRLELHVQGSKGSGTSSRKVSGSELRRELTELRNVLGLPVPSAKPLPTPPKKGVPPRRGTRN